MVLTLPTTLNGRYRLLERLGSGGLADVYRGEDLVLERHVAVKVVRDTADVDERPFAREISALGRLSHASIVRLYDGGTDGDVAYLVMELVEGGPLRDVIADEAPLDPARVGDIGRAVAGALAHAHAAGCVHRDVKPGNILLDDDRVRVTDFGVARLVDQTVTTTTGTLGTVAYVAPEQVDSGEVGPAADVYALGLVLLECLTGDRAFSGPWTEVALARLHRAPDIPGGLPAPWPQLLADMTRRDPADRPSAEEVVSRLDRHGGGRPAVPPDVEPARTQILDRTGMMAERPSGRAPRPQRQSNGWIGVLAVVLIVLAGWLFLRSDEPTDQPPGDDPPAEEAQRDEAGSGGAGEGGPPADLGEALDRLEEAVQR